MGVTQVETRDDRASRLRRVVSWAAVGLCGLYALFAAGSAVQVASGLIGSRADAAERAAPAFFALHGLAGALALLAGVIQLVTSWDPLERGAARHRFLGRAYAAGASLTACGGLVVTVAFNVGLVAKLVFTVWALAWMGATLIAVHAARLRRFGCHRDWMLRSYSLALVFVTFGFLHPVLEAAGAPRTTAYGAAMALSVVLNVAVAETWVLRRRARTERGIAHSATRRPGARAMSATAAACLTRFSGSLYSTIWLSNCG